MKTKIFEIGFLEALGKPGTVPEVTDWHVHTNGYAKPDERERMMEQVLGISRSDNIPDAFVFSSALGQQGWSLVSTVSVLEYSINSDRTSVHYQYIFQREIERET